MVKSFIDEQMVLLSLPQDLFQRLRDDILDGNLGEGQKISEKYICERYKVSRTPVREAFQKLELDGLVKIIPNKGAFVTGLTHQDIKDIYIMRAEYEKIAAIWAIERMSAEQLEQLDEIFDFMEFYTAKGNGEKNYQMNTYFHQLIYTMSQNRILQHTLTSFEVYSEKVRVSHAYPKEQLAVILEEHRDIYKALKAKDKDAASLAASNHVMNAALRAGYL